MRNNRTLHQRLGAALLFALVFMACSSQPGAAPPPPPGSIISVTVNVTGPASLAIGGTGLFEATVTQATDASVTWSVRGPSGESAGVGSIDPSGLFTAPALVPADPNVIVTATSRENPAALAEVVARILPVVTVSGATTIASGASHTFTATVSGYADPQRRTVTWSVAPRSQGGPTGTINPATGAYTAPVVAGNEIVTVVVTATSNHEPLASGSRTLEVRGENF